MVDREEASEEILWRPPADVAQTAAMGRFMRRVASAHDLDVSTYDQLWQWSIDDLGAFWHEVADFFDLGFDAGGDALADDAMPGAVWFPRERLNFAERALAGDPDDVVVVSLSETRSRRELTRDQLRQQVAALRGALVERGVGEGDRVVAYLPNIPEALVALYAAASIGAIFTSVAPESGSRMVVNKIAQLEPAVLVAVDGYRYGDKDFDRAGTVAEIRAQIPSIHTVIALDYLHPGEERVADAVPWSEVIADEHADLHFERFPLDTPLYIVFSSGTTGRPKAIVHSHGGIVLEHLKLWGLHEDVGADDRWFWHSSTNWMAWNYCASVLMCGATIVTYDGHPLRPDLRSYWRMLAAERITWLGTSPGFLLQSLRAGLVPREIADLTALRTITCGGSPLTADLFRWTYQAVSPTAYLASGSGGTDIASSFVAGTRLLPVRAGEIACRLLGVDAAALDDGGHELVGQRGELVVRQPMPSMPVGFWGDTDGHRYRDAYFRRFPGIWCHGDWAIFTSAGTCRVIGRSDATLNRGGVRLGTSEFYEVIDEMPAIEEALVVHVDDGDPGMGTLILFVTTPTGEDLPGEAEREIRASLRTELSPRHEPDRIVLVSSIPKSPTGKRQEVPVKRVLMDPTLGEAGDGFDEFRAIATALRSEPAREGGGDGELR
jgi:acetoacetyl-CoA synthetase